MATKTCKNQKDLTDTKLYTERTLILTSDVTTKIQYRIFMSSM